MTSIASAAATHLAAAQTTAEIVAAARAIVNASPHVRLHPERLADLVPVVQEAKPVSWNWYVSEGADLYQALFELTFNAASNGGYFARKPDGSIWQWEEKGSGSAALVSWIDSLRADNLVPAMNLDPVAIDAAIGPRVEGLPFAAQRLAICREFADLDRISALHALFDSCLHGDECRFDLDAVDRLVEIYPTGFTGDPFRKKAILALIMMAGWLASSGKAVVCDTPIPSDYQIPRILNWKGVIEVSDAFSAMLKSGELLDVRSGPVEQFRAAALVAAHDLGALAGIPDFLVDSALFTTFRKDADFQTNSLPPMRCDSFWF